VTAWGRPVKRAQHVLWWATQAQISDHAHVVHAFGKTEKHCLKVGQNTTAIRHRYDHNATKYRDERQYLSMAYAGASWLTIGAAPSTVFPGSLSDVMGC